MNRKERRKAEKKLGIDKFRRSLPFSQRCELIRGNILEGKKKQEEMKETVRIQDQKDQENLINSQISKRSLDLMINEDMDYYSATEKAKLEFGQKV